jgi:hypothetical protein
VRYTAPAHIHSMSRFRFNAEKAYQGILWMLAQPGRSCPIYGGNCLGGTSPVDRLLSQAARSSDRLAGGPCKVGQKQPVPAPWDRPPPRLAARSVLSGSKHVATRPKMANDRPCNSGIRGMSVLFSRGRWKSGSTMAPRAVLNRVMWSSLTTSQARATRRARWEFRGSVPLGRWAPNAGPAPIHA